MILFPAIDLKDGQCVRLRRATWARPPCSTPIRRTRRGGSPPKVPTGCIWSISTAPSPASRSMPRAVEAILAAVTIPASSAAASAISRRSRLAAKGVARVILGTAALKNPALVKGAARDFPAASPSASTPAAAGSRSKAGPRPATVTALDLARRFEDAGVGGDHLHRYRPRRRCCGRQCRGDRRARRASSRFR